MRSNRRRDTKPELAVRRLLHANGLRYRVDVPLDFDHRRRADIVFPAVKLVVFIDGCFWHGCPVHYSIPATNKEFWSTKRTRNSERDKETTQRLTEEGWAVRRYWEHDDPADVAENILAIYLPSPAGIAQERCEASVSHDRSMTIGEVLRYTKPSAQDTLTHSYRNFWELQSRGLPLVQLERGINSPEKVPAPDGARMPVLALRSSPDKAGSVLTPWHDEFDLDRGMVRYFGEHRVDKDEELGRPIGDQRLETSWQSHRATSEALRAAAPPILVFRTVTGQTTSGPRAKGFVEFVGLAVMTDLREIEQRDPISSRHFPNYLTELALLDLGPYARLSWEWIDARRNRSMTSVDALELAPEAWRSWVRLGRTALPAQTRVEGMADTDPVPSMPSAAPERVAQPPGVRLPFAWVAARAVESLLGLDRTRMLTGAERNGVVEFRGTHRLGVGGASAPLRVVAVAARAPQAALEAARSLMAQLGAGQVGVLVTPAPLPESELAPLRRPGSPLVVLHGDSLRSQVLQIAEASFDGDLSRMDAGEPESPLAGGAQHR